MVGKILKDKLLREGYAVTCLEEAPAIQAALDESPPDLLILNAMLPEGLGIRLFQGIPRRAGALPYPVVLTFDKSLHPEEEPRIEALQPSAVIPLPFKPTEVARQVRRLLAP